MPGRPDFSQSGTDGGGQTVAVTERPEIERVAQTNSTSIAAGGSETVEVYAPTGSIYRLSDLSIAANPPGSATSGTHRFTTYSAGSGLQVARGASNQGDEVRYAWGHWASATNEALPTTEVAQNRQIKNMSATENNPLKVGYANKTDVSTSQDRNYTFIVEEVSY